MDNTDGFKDTNIKDKRKAWDYKKIFGVVIGIVIYVIISLLLIVFAKSIEEKIRIVLFIFVFGFPPTVVFLNICFKYLKTE
jgi:hypothetical protein